MKTSADKPPATRVGRLHVAARYWRDHIELKSGTTDSKTERMAAMVAALTKADARCENSTLEKCLGIRNDPNPEWLPESNTLLALCTLAGLSLDWLTTGEGEMLLSQRRSGATPEDVAQYIATALSPGTSRADATFFAIDGHAALRFVVTIARGQLARAQSHHADILYLRVHELDLRERKRPRKAAKEMLEAIRFRLSQKAREYEAAEATFPGAGIVKHDSGGSSLRSLSQGVVRIRPVVPQRRTESNPPHGTKFQIGGNVFEIHIEPLLTRPTRKK